MKNVLKKSLSIFLAISIIFSSAIVGLGEVDFNGLLEVKADAASGYDLTFKLNSDGISYSVTDCNSYASGELVIPSVYNGLPVTSIGNYAFYYCNSLTSVTIPDSITSIGNYAFYKCTSLAYVGISNSVTSIGKYAFYNCTSLTSIIIPVSVTGIGCFAFCGCAKLNTIIIPDSVASIGKSAFYCTGYFNNYSNWENGVLYINNHLIKANKSIPSKYVIRYGTKTIADFAFCGTDSSADCSCSYTSNSFKNLTSITIPDSVTNIGDSAFNGCTSLTTLTIGNGVTRIGERVFSCCTSLASIVIPDNVKSIGAYAFNGCTSLASVTIGSGLTSIGNGVFSCCTSLLSITIPDTVTNIGSNAFYKCSNLLSVKIGNGVTNIGNSAFEYCTSLMSIVIPNNVTSIGASAFDCCTNLMSIVIPENVTSIGNHTFYKCASLTSVVIPDGVTSIGNYAFYKCASLTSIVIPDSVTTIGYDAFNRCTSLKSITLPDNVTKIADSTFEYCIKLETITIPDSVTNIEYDAFYCCSNLENVYYMGTEEQWNKISIGSYNSSLLNATKHYHVHSYSEWIVDIESTCTEEGSKHKECVVCKKVLETAEIVTLPHQTYWETIKEATCLEEGCRIKKCKTCDNQLEVETIAIKDHSLSDWIIEKAATCTTDGSKYKQCVDCGGKIEVATIYATGHTEVVDAAVAPTCTIAGKTEGSHCAVCNAVIKAQTTVAATGHILSDWIIEKAATCTTDGSKYKQCVDCGGKIEVATIYATGHTEVVDAAVAPTCTIAGKTEGSHCAVCNAVIKAQITVAATGHILSDWIVDKQATVYKSGSKHKECTECGEVIKTGTIPQLKCATPVLKKVSNVNSYVKITWGTVKGTDLYRVYRRIGTGDYKYIGSAIGTYFNDKEAPAGKTCRYMVRAKNESGYSEFSESLAIKHVDEPKLKTIQNTSAGVKITWGKVTGAEKYNVYRKVSGGEYKYIGATSRTYYTDKTAKSGNKYYYAIRGKRGDNVSSQSASLYKYYLAGPTLKSIDNTEFGVLIKWDKVKGREEYNVYRKTSGGSYSKIGTTKNTYYTDKKAKSGKKYYYIVKAVKGSATSASSSAKSIYHLADPTLKTPSSTKSGVTLKWTKVTGAQGYMVYRKTGSGSYTKIKTEKGVSNLSYTDKSAKKGKKYTYKIKAYKSSTYSAYSNAKAITDKY